MAELTSPTAEDSPITVQVLDYIDSEMGRPVPVRDLVEELEGEADAREVRKAVVKLSQQGRIHRVDKDSFAGRPQEREHKHLSCTPSVDREFSLEIFESAEDWLVSYVGRGNHVHHDEVVAAILSVGWESTDQEIAGIVSRLVSKNVLRIDKNGFLESKTVIPQNTLRAAKDWLLSLFKQNDSPLPIEDILLYFLEDEGASFSMSAVQENLIRLLARKLVYTTSDGLKLLTEEQILQRKALAARSTTTVASGSSRVRFTDVIENVLREANRLMTIDEVTEVVRSRGFETTRPAVGGALVHLAATGRISRKADGVYAHPSVREEAPASQMRLSDVVEDVLRETGKIMTIDEITEVMRSRGVSTNRTAVSGSLVYLAGKECATRKARGTYAHPSVQNNLTLARKSLNEVVENVLRKADRIMTTDEVTKAVRSLGKETTKSSVSATLIRLTQSDCVVRKAKGTYAHPSVQSDLALAHRSLNEVVENVLREAGRIMTVAEVTTAVRSLGKETTKAAVSSALVRLTQNDRIRRTSAGTYAHANAKDDLAPQKTTVTDLIEQILLEAGRPMSISEIIKSLDSKTEKEHSYPSTAAALSYLRGRERIERVKRGVYAHPGVKQES